MWRHRGAGWIVSGRTERRFVARWISRIADGEQRRERRH